MSPVPHSSTWVDQFVLRGRGSSELLNPFDQTVAAASMLARVAEDRSGLGGRHYDQVGTARYQALLLAEYAQQLDQEVDRLAARAEQVRRSPTGAHDQTRTLMTSLSGVIRSTATLAEVCHALLRVAEQLLVIRRPKSRIELAAAVEALRAALGTAEVTVHANLPRITDAVTYDQLASGLESFAAIRRFADRIGEEARRGGTSLSPVPAQRFNPVPL